MTAVQQAQAQRVRRNLSLEKLIPLGTDTLRSYLEVDQNRTSLLKQLAEVVVLIRSKHKDKDGNTDWAGRSADYQAVIAQIYTDAGVPPDSKAGVQAALRYHIGNALRDIAPAPQLRKAGLATTSPKQRANGGRGAIPAPVITALRESDMDGAPEALRLLKAAVVAIQVAADQGVPAKYQPQAINLIHDIQNACTVMLHEFAPRQRGRPPTKGTARKVLANA